MLKLKASLGYTVIPPSTIYVANYHSPPLPPPNSSLDRMDSARVQLSGPSDSITSLSTCYKTLLNAHCVPGLCLIGDSNVSKFGSNASLGNNILDRPAEMASGVEGCIVHRCSRVAQDDTLCGHGPLDSGTWRKCAN